MAETRHDELVPDVTAAAADWFARLQEDDVAEQEFQEWQRWLNASQEHRRAYRDIEQAWRMIGEVRPIPWPTADELEQDSAPPGRHTFPGTERRWAPRLPWALAAATLLMIAAAVSGYWIDRTGKVLATKVAETRSVRLSDGSRVILGAHSQVSARFSADQRRVELHFGEAFFDVAPDPRRPFVVVSGTNEIRAVGTAFNVRAAPDRVLVSVTEGRVAIRLAHGAGAQSAPGANVAAGNGAANEKPGKQTSSEREEAAPAAGAFLLLSAGEQAAITKQGAHKRDVAAENAVTWVQGRLEYRGEELRHVLEDLNRYTERPIVLADESLGNLRYSGTVFPDHLEEWLQGISGALPVIVHEAKDGRTIAASR